MAERYVFTAIPTAEGELNQWGVVFEKTNLPGASTFLMYNRGQL